MEQYHLGACAEAFQIDRTTPSLSAMNHKTSITFRGAPGLGGTSFHRNDPPFQSDFRGSSYRRRPFTTRKTIEFKFPVFRGVNHDLAPGVEQVSPLPRSTAPKESTTGQVGRSTTYRLAIGRPLPPVGPDSLKRPLGCRAVRFAQHVALSDDGDDDGTRWYVLRVVLMPSFCGSFRATQAVFQIRIFRRSRARDHPRILATSLADRIPCGCELQRSDVGRYFFPQPTTSIFVARPEADGGNRIANLSTPRLRSRFVHLQFRGPILFLKPEDSDLNPATVAWKTAGTFFSFGSSSATGFPESPPRPVGISMGICPSSGTFISDASRTPPTITEDRVSFPVIPLEPRHVLDQAENRHVHFGKHRHRFPRIDQCDFLRSRHDHRSIHRHGLHDGQLDIPGSRRKIENQHIEFAPRDLPEKLLGVASGHRSTHDHRAFLFQEKTHGHQLQPMRLDRDDLVMLVRIRALGGAEHLSN